MLRFLLPLTLFIGYSLSLVLALPFQAPLNGSYQCFSSSESPFAESVQDVDARLEFTSVNTYRFTTATASEEGTVKSYNFEIGEGAFDIYWQGGSLLELQPSSGSAPYAGMFLLDNFGASYTIIQNNHGLYIRCQSDGADIAATFRAVPEEPVAETLATQATNMTTSFENLQPLQSFQIGVYGCSHTLKHTFWVSSDSPRYYPDDDPDIFGLFMFPDSTMLEIGAKDKFLSQYVKGRYSFDTATSQISFQGGVLSNRTLSYGTNTKGQAAFSLIETWRTNPDTTDEEWVSSYDCQWMQDLPANLGMGLAESTPQIDLNTLKVATSKYDPNINPNIEPIVDTYYCYPSFAGLDWDESLPRYVREYKLEILPNHHYTFNGQQGTYATRVDDYDLQWQSGPLNPTGSIIKGPDDYSVPHTADVSFDTWGSKITRIRVPQKEDREIQIDCFQQGAREQKSLLDFLLKQPTPANYTCLPSGDHPQPLSLELLPDNRYIFNGQEGSYSSEVQEDRSNIFWQTGPLMGSDTSYSTYSADDSTGLREITFTSTQFFGIIPVGSSTEQTMYCQAVVKANVIPKYADAAIAPPPAGTGGLSGFYAKAEYDQGDVINGQMPVTTWYYYHFLPNGYVYQNGYSTGDDCTKTYPNGQAVCKGYSYSSNKITFTGGMAMGVMPADGGDLLLDGVLYENKTLSGSQTLNATYENVVAFSSPMVMQMAGMGTNSVSTRRYTFSSDGTYSYSYDSWSQTSAPAMFSDQPFGTVGALSSSSTTDGDGGTYSIDGNIITFTSDQGYTTQCGFFFPSKDDLVRINICDVDYSLTSPQ